MIAGKDVVFLSSLSSNDATLSQFSVLIVLLQSFIRSLTIVLPYYPGECLTYPGQTGRVTAHCNDVALSRVLNHNRNDNNFSQLISNAVGTMDRVDVEGKVATANTYATILSSLPSCGTPARLMIYDIHALQERFFFHQNVVPSLHSGLPLLKKRILDVDITAAVFPDDGAAKRFSHFFSSIGYDTITCGKHREGDKRRVVIQDGDPAGKSVILIDDLIQTGSTLLEAAKVLREGGAKHIYAYVTHAIFPRESWRKFLYDSASSPEDRLFTTFWTTNSVPSTTSQLPSDNVFEVLDLLPQIVADLDFKAN